MSAVSRPRGPLPRRIYWVRRVLVLAVGCGFVLGIAQLLASTGNDSGPDSARPVVASPTGTPSAGGPTSAPAGKQVSRKERRAARKLREKVARPDGPCDDGDVRVTPTVAEAHAGTDIEVVLELTTVEAEACTWEVTPESVFLTIASEEGVIWSSQECPATIPVEAVVPRRKKADKVTVLWNGKESDEECTPTTAWLGPGFYSASAVARGSVTPIDAGFVIGGPVRATVTSTPTPTTTPTATPGREKKRDGKRR